jgi:hypothetical protein
MCTNITEDISTGSSDRLVGKCYEAEKYGVRVELGLGGGRGC